jgi:hypothetical protein
MGAGFRRMQELAPGPWFNTAGAAQYTELYMTQLRGLDPQATVDKMHRLGGGADVALLCFEAPGKPDEWCHRGHVSAWLKDTLDLAVFEFGHERDGCGWGHPKLPYQFRTTPSPEPIDVTPYLGRKATDPQGRSWTVTGQNPDLPNQALITDEANGEVRSISRETLEKKFGDEPTLI